MPSIVDIAFLNLFCYISSSIRSEHYIFIECSLTYINPETLKDTWSPYCFRRRKKKWSSFCTCIVSKGLLFGVTTIQTTIYPMALGFDFQLKQKIRRRQKVSVRDSLSDMLNRPVENGLVFFKGSTGSITKRYWYFAECIDVHVYQKKSHRNPSLTEKVINASI